MRILHPQKSKGLGLMAKPSTVLACLSENVVPNGERCTQNVAQLRADLVHFCSCDVLLFCEAQCLSEFMFRNSQAFLGLSLLRSGMEHKNHSRRELLFYFSLGKLLLWRNMCLPFEGFEESAGSLNVLLLRT